MIDPYYQDDLVTLYHGDCLDVLPLVAGVDLVVTSPPYNLGASPWPSLGHWKPGQGSGGKSKWRNGSDAGGGVQYDDHEDAIDWPLYVWWQHLVWRAMWATLTEPGAIFWNHKHRVIGARLWTPNELIPADLPLRQEVVWARAGGVNFTEVALCPTTERVYVVAHDAWRLRSKGASGIGDCWRFPQEPSDHPAPFPVALPERAIAASPDPQLVLDPFAGSGTTLVAARKAGIRAVGIERSERYCAMAAARLGSWEHSVNHEGSLFGWAQDGDG